VHEKRRFQSTDYLTGVRNMAEEIGKSLFEVAEHVYKIWEKIPKTKILNQEATINVPESVVDYSLAISIPGNLRAIRKVIEVSAPSIHRVSASVLSPMPRTAREAIKSYPCENGRVAYGLFPELLPPDSELISMTVSYTVDDISLLDDLVDRKKAHEPSGTEKNEYWMSAQLKHPKALVGRFGRFDLRDVDVTVDVGVTNELRNTIPSAFITRLKMFFQIMAETDPRRQHLAVPMLRRLAREKTAGQEFRILTDLESLFLPGAFSKYIEVLRDFRYSDCYKGKEFFELPIQIIPKKMNVISRADLTLEKPAADGTLVYKNNLLVEAIRSVLTKDKA
jgi:hypothetical protein